MKKQRYARVLCCGVATIIGGCAPIASLPTERRLPALEYSRNVHQAQSEGISGSALPSDERSSLRTARAGAADGERARLRFANEEGGVAAGAEVPRFETDENLQDTGYQVERSTRPNVPDYNGPLSLGDPGVSASLWQESRSDNDLVRDFRAFQPMDLLTIVVSEDSEGSKEADTEVKEESEVSAGIAALFNIEKSIEDRNPGLDTSNLVQAQTTNDFKGEGETTRKGSLTARISAMVVEVLPSGILRIEGEKIISVNSEEQVMVISGLVRTRDINSNNEVQSSQLANLRIDYFGRGVVGEAQDGGWFSRLMRIVWPF